MPLCASNETRAVELIQGLNVGGPFKIESLSGGHSGSEVMKISTPDKAYVVRFWNMFWADYFPQDLACALIASDAGYGPKIYFVDEVSGITVMDYHFPESLPEVQIRLPILVDLLKKIHAGPMVPKGVDRAIYLDELIEDLKETKLFDLEVIRTIKDTVFAATRVNAHCVACHRDLHQGNLLYSQGTIYAIDYTWGAMDDPYADLANVAVFHCQTAEEEGQLMQLYLGREPRLEEIARLSLMKLPAKIFYGLELLGIAVAGGADLSKSQLLSRNYMDLGRHGLVIPNPNDYLDYAASLLGEAVDYAQSEQYAKDLASLVD
ncbi:MAG: phosphotransferase [Chlamydiales bacterium]|nr:phosphotransferase [Chlamydiales bacterium]